MTLEIEAKTVIKIILVILAFLFLYLLRDVLMVLLFSIIIASAVSPFASWLESKRVPRMVGVMLFYVLFFGLLVAFLSLAIPIVASELNQLTQTLPKLFEQVQQAGSSRYVDFVTEIQNFLESSSQFLQTTSSSIFSLLIDIFGGLISFISIIVISFYFSVMKQGVATFFKSILPATHEGYAIGLWKRAEAKVGKWLQGQLLLALIVGFVVFVGLSLLNVKYALLLGIIAMIFELIPYVGPVMAAVPALILAFLQSPTLGFWVLIFYVAVQQLENQLLTPLILGKTTGLHPVTVVVALLIGAKLAGILGVLLAVPVAVILVEVFEDLAAQRHKAMPM
ncbi:MAG: AI-2E family transporter [Patescibacteria group bacterium]